MGQLKKKKKPVHNPIGSFTQPFDCLIQEKAKKNFSIVTNKWYYELSFYLQASIFIVSE